MIVIIVLHAQHDKMIVIQVLHAQHDHAIDIRVLHAQHNHMIVLSAQHTRSMTCDCDSDVTRQHDQTIVIIMFQA